VLLDAQCIYSLLMQPPLKKLLDQVWDAIRLVHYAYRTEETYVQCIRRHILKEAISKPSWFGLIAPSLLLPLPLSYPPTLRSRVKILITSPELGAGNNGLHRLTSAKPR
jgi:hypothetical protein